MLLSFQAWPSFFANSLMTSCSCYRSRLKELSQETTLVLSNTRELDKVPKTK